MRKPTYTPQFERDLRLLQRRDKKIEKLKEILTTLINAEPFAERYRDHPLKGKFKHRRECHVEPDWLLSYKLAACRTGIQHPGAVDVSAGVRFTI